MTRGRLGSPSSRAMPDFFILPWIRTEYPASQLRFLAACRIQDYWRENFAFAPVLLETFVECDLFRTTCYKAAKWIIISKTQGCVKLEVNKQFALLVKDINLYAR